MNAAILVICVLMLFLALFLGVARYLEKGPSKGIEIAVILIACALLLPRVTELFQ